MNNYLDKPSSTPVCGFVIYISNHFKSKGYSVSSNDLSNNEIDLICWRDNNLILVQCKDLTPIDRNKLSHIDLKAFIDSCDDCMEEKSLRYSTLKRMLISTSNILDFSAKKYLEDSDSIEYLIMGF